MDFEGETDGQNQENQVQIDKDALISGTESLSLTNSTEKPISDVIQNQNGDQKKKKKKKSGKVPRNMITPEYIEEMRKQREEKKREKREALIKQGLDPDAQINEANYLKRELLSIPRRGGEEDGEENRDSIITLKIMTYNLLAQALIRRKLFPDNGDILKWHKRSKVLFQELRDYDCDILCLQEVDFVQYKSFWRPELEKLGYQTKFQRGADKNHGVSVFFKHSLFNLVDTCLIDFDNEKSGDVKPRTITKNVGLILGLAIRNDPSKLITIGTAHLFWHPFGTYERTRQTYVVLSKSKEFERRIQILHPEITKIWKFFAGDFNSQPYDSPYLSITSKPICYNDRCMRVIACSTSFQFSSLRNGGSGEEEEGGNVEKFGENQPKDPVPESYVATEEQQLMVKQIEQLHNDLPLRAISLYSMAYREIDPENSGLDNDRNEPFFSNWAHTWRGLLDYIFFVKEWDVKSDHRNIDSIPAFERENKVRLDKLLKLPHPKEMGPGQPRENEYPSDHLCLIAQISLLK
ncbi:hypothetical protein PICMEDRAFT_18319 [Pichia membranifaciens NRRL Y-2026]|uniref:Endonuclease/exonuclease/phosphatase domain-containing protein n=1 Tax=Pichia membranifaciens NRRL Y-2026 TaxID=763406 RepID=A0A1E3NE50_9ASCO|nr:hypothetical protein PICMEDRAFT_18319 [Pichia membranifaciens NRRL Y-2026]ODQ44410.1 hypothetical protein PICMEDRAFT_18319 [Pichia membranifaciens NRRL Y-2026]